ncbi:hypothetical protein O6H91_04G036900 [Diphasiastrum complanatum]|uniref:Uncharacterized protein n=2 Tax=Diphasiastrum complanatum TaxID=34168 RepID=A0ACC2DW42_DIPCM|nr:hypothetical protein O6H91_04G036900 [Diphasiastrum complanatum]KAJ7558385.1 hypothetical protein O6H91_04G036900 [Diphasiastrum complanatum]
MLCMLIFLLMFIVPADSMDFCTPIEKNVTNDKICGSVDPLSKSSNSKLYVKWRAKRRKTRVDQERSHTKFRLEINEFDQSCGPSKEIYVQRISTVVRSQLDFTKKSIREHSKAEIEVIQASLETQFDVDHKRLYRYFKLQLSKSFRRNQNRLGEISERLHGSSTNRWLRTTKANMVET